MAIQIKPLKHQQVVNYWVHYLSQVSSYRLHVVAVALVVNVVYTFIQVVVISYQQNLITSLKVKPAKAVV